MTGQGDSPHNGPNRPPFHLPAIIRHYFAQAGHISLELLSTLNDITRHGLDDFRLALLRQVYDEVEHPDDRDDDENNIDNDNIDNNVNNGNEDNLNEVAGAAAVDVEVNQPVEEEDPQPGGSRRRSREDDDEDEENSSKRFRWWDEFADTDSEADSLSDADTDIDTDDNLNENAGAEDGVNGEVSQPEEEDPLPGRSRKRARDEDNDDDRSSKQFRR